MIEVAILNYLNGTLPVSTYMMRPENPPEQYCLMELTGSSLNEHIYTSTLAIQTYAPTLYDAAQIAWSACDAMREAADLLAEIASVDLNSIYNFTDPETKQPRYQAVFDVIHY